MSSINTNDYHCLLDNSVIEFVPHKETTISFLKDVYRSIMKRTFGKFNYFILQELIDIPLLIIEKVFNFINRDHKKGLSMNNFSNGLYELLFSEPIYKISLLFDFIDFDKDGYVYKSDVYLILSQFHLHCSSDMYIPLLEKVINNFFNSNTTINKDDFITQSSTINSDIVLLLQLYIKICCCFFSNSEISFYSTHLGTMHSKNVCVYTSSQISFYVMNSTNEVKEYLNVIKDNLIEKIDMLKVSENELDLEDLSMFEVDFKEIFHYVNSGMFPMKINDSYIHEDCVHKKRTASTKKQYHKTDTIEGNQSPILKKRELGLTLISKKTEDTTSVSGFIKQFTNNKTISDITQTQISHLYSRKNSNLTPVKNKNLIKSVTLSMQSSFPLHHSINEIYCFKSKNNLKTNIIIKLKLIGSFIFYFKLVNNIFILKKIIPIFSLYPKTYNNNTSSLIQFELVSSVFNYHKQYSFFIDNQNGHLNTFIDLMNKHKGVRNIKDFYKMKEPLGKGKFGIVNLCENKSNSKLYAVKIINKRTTIEEEYKICRWERSINKLLLNMNNKNIIKCYDVFDDYNHCYFIYEYIQGCDLKKYTKKQLYKRKSNLDIKHYSILHIAFQLINGLHYLHKYGIIHRDIKASNILITKKNQNVKIIDFGLSRVMSLHEYSNDPYGSLCFKAPELILQKPYSFQVDIWALGITLYYLLYKDYPFEKNTKENIKQSILNGTINLNINKETNIVDNDANNSINKDNEYLLTLHSLIKDCLDRNSNTRINIATINQKYINNVTNNINCKQ